MSTFLLEVEAFTFFFIKKISILCQLLFIFWKFWLFLKKILEVLAFNFFLGPLSFKRKRLFCSAIFKFISFWSFCFLYFKIKALNLFARATFIDKKGVIVHSAYPAVFYIVKNCGQWGRLYDMHWAMFQTIYLEEILISRPQWLLIE